MPGNYNQNYLYMKQNPQFIKAAVIAVIIAGAIGALLVMGGGSFDIGGAKAFGICLLFIIFGITAAICMVTAEKATHRMLGNAGMITSGAGFLVAAISILGEIRDQSLVQIGGALLIASIALAHICLLYHFTLQNKYAHYARTAAVTAIGLFAFLFIIRIFEPMMDIYSLAGSQSSIRLLIAALMIDLAATLLVPLCNRLEPSAQQPVTIAPAAAPEETEPPPAAGDGQQA